ncbi:polysaccharide deacetylase family protein [Microvirga antarctica]|uniref:polysaccharide deacetylase family protein n=1 Tax=Microvirga antarctica TaxID=2819233 RepID=UPI001B30EBEA|nr:polysaccharide deacetylase [Microvirga antarctica]
MTDPDLHASPFPRYSWPGGKTSAFCFTVDVDAESPYLWGRKDAVPDALIGQMEQRLFGPRTGIWRLLDLLDRHAMKGTFFVPGLVAENHPALLPAFVARGHEVGLHGYFHEVVADIQDDEFVRALDESFAIFARQIGAKPTGFRSPAWEMTPFMLAELKRRDLYDSSLMGFDHPYTIDGVTEIPVQWAIDDAIYFKFVGSGADRWAPSSQTGVLDSWLDEWDVLKRERGLFMLTVHDWISGRAGRIRMLERLLESIANDPAVWIATVGEVARHHRSLGDGFSVTSRVPDAIGARRFKGAQ